MNPKIKEATNAIDALRTDSFQKFNNSPISVNADISTSADNTVMSTD